MRANFAVDETACDRSSAFYAHSFGEETVPSERWQKLADHLRGVARLARQFAEAARTCEVSVSCPPLTFAAIKGIFESIVWLKSAEVRLTRVEICALLVFHTYATNYGGTLWNWRSQ